MAKLKKRLKFSLPQIFVVVLIVAAIGMVGYYFGSLKSSVSGIDSSVNQEQDITADWKTYSTDLLTFKYPSNYRVEEREKNYFIVVEDKTTVAPTEGIAIDARLENGFESYDYAINIIKDNAGEIQEENVNGHLKLTGFIRSGSGPAVSTLVAFVKYGRGAIVISHTQLDPEAEIFDNLLKSFQLK